MVDDVVVLLALEPQDAQVVCVGKLSVLGIAGCAAPIDEMLLEHDVVGVEAGQRFEPGAILVDAGRKSVEHGIGRIVHRAAELVEIRAEAFGMVVVGPQNATCGKRTVARTGRIRALLENDARRPIALLGDGDRRSHAGKAAAHDENVGLFVP